MSDHDAGRIRVAPGSRPSGSVTFISRQSSPSSPRHTSPRRGADAARWWFGALDGRQLVVDGTRCLMRVAGIHSHRQHLWIQLEREDGEPGVVVHVTPGTRLEDALTAIATSGASVTGPVIVDAPQASGPGRRRARAAPASP